MHSDTPNPTNAELQDTDEVNLHYDTPNPTNAELQDSDEVNMHMHSDTPNKQCNNTGKQVIYR